MAQQVYLILIRDGSLALTAGAALEERLAAEGHPGVALVPARRGTNLAGPGQGPDLGYLAKAIRGGGSTPQVVALYEDGLLDMLQTLGLAAYVGVPDDHDWRIIHFDDTAAGAMLLPVATGRDLVDAVAAHVPCSTAHRPEGALPAWRLERDLFPQVTWFQIREPSSRHSPAGSIAARTTAPAASQDSAGSTVIPAARAASRGRHAVATRRSAAGSMVSAVAKTRKASDADPLVPGEHRPHPGGQQGHAVLAGLCQSVGAGVAMKS